MSLARVSERTHLNRQQLLVNAYQREDGTLAVAEVTNARTGGVLNMINVEGSLLRALVSLHEEVGAAVR